MKRDAKRAATGRKKVVGPADFFRGKLSVYTMTHGPVIDPLMGLVGWHYHNRLTGVEIGIPYFDGDPIRLGALSRSQHRRFRKQLSWVDILAAFQFQEIFRAT